MKKKNSIKRAQSQAGLSFAERKNFRPMAKFFTMLALLCLTATGAWALPGEETVYVPSGLYFEVSGTSVTLKYDAAFDISSDKPFYGTKKDMDHGVVINSTMGWYKVSNQDYSEEKETYTTLTVDESCKNFTGTSLTKLFANLLALTTINNLENLNTSEVTNMQRMFFQCPLTSLDLSSFQTSNVTDMQDMFSNGKNLETIYVGDGWSTANVTSSGSMFYNCSKLPNFNSSVVDKTNAHTGDGGYLTYKAPGIDLTFNDDKTEASFDMPAYDVTVNYELVRDMEIDVDADIAERIRIQMNGGKFELVDATLMVPVIVDMLDNANDTLTVTTDYTVTLQKKDGENWVAGDANDLSVATYRFKVTGAGLYDGTIYTNEFRLFMGYEVEVGAESFATFYMDEKLTVEESSTTGELYTISSVSADEAVLSAQIGVAPANTPLLVYNSGSVKKTILLIPTDDQADNVTAYSGFKGTLVASTIAASNNDQTNYALNGKQFVWVKNALSIAANKCWLEVVNSNARAISILFTGETTGIESIDHEPLTIDHWYDLNGRKVTAPTRKGIYIQNGKKVVK